MLFKQIYNWIKYKTTPPSFLFKNRLFIERDSKHKRIFNNLGLTFRNVKWNAYESENTQNRFKTQYWKIFFFFVIVFVVVLYIINFHKYYLLSFLYNNLFYCIWISVDAFDYYASFLIWLIFLIISFIWNLIKTYFFFNNNIIDQKFTQFNNFDSKKHLLIVNTVTNSLSKKDYKWYLIKWLNANETSQTQQITQTLSNFFTNSSNINWWKTNHDFFIKLYKLTNMLNLNNLTQTSFFKLTKFNVIENVFLLKNIEFFSIYQRYPILFLEFLLRQNKSYFNLNLINKTSTKFLKENMKWNLSSISFGVKNDSHLLNNLTNFFYFNEFSAIAFLNFAKKNNQLELVNSLLNTQINSAKWNRWLYKYSILHRKIFKNSHKLTLTKKLLNSTFYNTDLSKKNLWYSELFNKATNKNLLHFVKTLLDSEKQIDSFFNNSTISNMQYLSKKNLINTHENSFFWFVKRFYFFSTLSNNKSFSNILLKKTVIFDKSQINDFTILNSFLIKSLFFHFKNFNTHFSNYNITNIKTNKKFLNNQDSFLSFSDLDLFDKDNLEILNWIVSPTLASSNLNLNNFFYSNLYEKTLISKQIKFYNNLLVKNIILKQTINFSIYHIDANYLNDLIFLFTFYQK